MTTKQDIEVKLTFLNTNEGGRTTPVKSGYRTQFHFGSDGASDWTISLEFEGQDWVKPGDEVHAHGVFLCPDIVNSIQEKMPFQLREGSRVVARGEVLNRYL